MPQFTTDYKESLSHNNPDGCYIGKTATDKVAFYGGVPVVQRDASALHQASVLSVSSNATIAATLTAWMLEVTATLVGLGIWV